MVLKLLIEAVEEAPLLKIVVVEAEVRKNTLKRKMILIKNAIIPLRTN
jgi:hypothetical protein